MGRPMPGWTADITYLPMARGFPYAEALARGVQRRPGCQFSIWAFTQVLQDHSVKIGMDGKGWYADNIFVERLWHTVRYEEVYLKTYANATEARRELGAYFRFYNHQGPHQALSYRTPAEALDGDPTVRQEESKHRSCSDGPVSGLYAGVTGTSLNSTLILSN